MSNTTTMFDYKGKIFSGRELLAIEIGREIEQEQIRARIMDRVKDLKTCGDDDDCHQFGEFIESYIPEWLGEEE